MPTYDFECVKCNARFDSFQAVSAPCPKCPKCGKKTKKLISLNMGGLIFRGSGFYCNEYKKR